MKEFQNKTKDELMKLLKEKQNELLELNFGKAVKNIKNTAKIKIIRQDIARIMTMLRSI